MTKAPSARLPDAEALVRETMRAIYDDGNGWWGVFRLFLDGLIHALVWKHGTLPTAAAVAECLRLERYLALASDPELPRCLRDGLRRPFEFLHGYDADNGFFRRIHVVEGFGYVSMILTRALGVVAETADMERMAISPGDDADGGAMRKNGRAIGVELGGLRSDSLQVDFRRRTGIRPLSDFPELAAARPEALRSYDISAAGIFWPEIGFLLAASVLEQDSWGDWLVLKYDIREWTQAERDLATPRRLIHDGAATEVTVDGGAFVVRRGDDVVVRRIGAYPELAEASADRLAGYRLTPGGLKFPRLSDKVVVAFPQADARGFVFVRAEAAAEDSDGETHP